MYNCKMCGDATPAGESIIRRVVQAREKTYHPRQYKRGKQTDPDAGSGMKTIFDPGGVGIETVKEAAVCSDCAYALDTGVPFRAFAHKPRAIRRGPRAKGKAQPAPVLPEVLTTTRIKPGSPSTSPQ